MALVPLAGSVSRRHFLAGVSAIGCGVALAAGPLLAHAGPGSPAAPLPWHPSALPGADVLLDDSCLSLADAGWQVSPVANPGAYITDHAGTVANPLGVPFDAVPEGQYLMKATPLSGVHISTDGMAHPLPLGAGSWQIAFRLAVTDLMEPYRLPQSNGLRLWVQCGDVARGGRYFDFSFMPTAEVALVMAGGAFATVAVPGGWDGEVHDWVITFDGFETVRLHFDGAEIAAWSYAGSAVTLTEGITFYNRTLDGVSGTNDVRFDQIQVAATRDRLLADPGTRWADEWVATPASATVFFGDHDRSAGSVDWMSDIPEGSYLLRSVQRGAGTAVWTDPLGPGHDRWSVAVQARFAQFSYSGTHLDADLIVFGWDIVSGGVRHRIGWRPDQSLVAVGADGVSTVLAEAWPNPATSQTLRLDRTPDGTVVAHREDELLGALPPGAASEEHDSITLTIGDPGVYGSVAVWIRSIDIVRGHPVIHDTGSALARYWSAPAITGATAEFGDALAPAKAGEYRAGARSRAVGTLDLRFPIRAEDGQWTVDTTLRFPDFRVSLSDRDVEEIVFGWDIVIDGRRHRVGWRPDLALVAATGDGHQVLIPGEPVWGQWHGTKNHTWRLGGDDQGRLIVRRDGEVVGVAGAGAESTEADRVRLIVGSSLTAGPVVAVITSVVVARNVDPVWFHPVIDSLSVHPTVDTRGLRAVVGVTHWDPQWAEDPTCRVRWTLRDASGAVTDSGVVTEWAAGARFDTTPVRPGEHVAEVSFERGGRSLATASRVVRVPRVCTVTGPSPRTDSRAVGEDLFLTGLGTVAGDTWQRTTVSVGDLADPFTCVGTAAGSQPVVLALAVVGWYAISIGVLSESTGLAVTVGSERHVVGPVDPPRASGLVEWFVTTADLTGTSITLAPDGDDLAVVGYLRLRRLSPGEMRLASRPNEGPQGRRVIYNNDGTTDIVQRKVSDVEELRAISAGRYRGTDVGHLTYGMGATTMVWSNSAVVGTVAEIFDLTPEQRALMRSADVTTMDFMLATVTDDQDPLGIVAREADTFDLPVLASLRMSAFYSPSSYPWLNGPRYPELYEKYRMIGVDGGTPADSASVQGLSLTHEAYRELLVDLLVEATATAGVDGLELDFCRRPRLLGWDAAFMASYQQEHGVSPLEELSGAGLERLIAHRAGIMTDFLRRVRATQPNKIICVRVPYGYNLPLGLDVETWVAERLIDILVPNTWTLEDFWTIDGTFPDLVAGTGIKLYGGIEAVINGQDSSKASENLAASGVRSTVASARMTRQQYLLRTAEFYAAGYDGVYIFNNPSGDQSLGRLGDKIVVEKWRSFGFPPETVQEAVTTIS